MRLISCGPDDWSAWSNLRLRALADAPDAFSSTFEQWQHASEAQWRKRLREVPFNVIAVENGDWIGMASAAHGERAGYRLISMWVDPKARGRGIGDALVDAVLRYARAHNATCVELDVVAANAAARRLYERCGFRCEGEIADGSPCSGEIRMSRAL